MRTVGEYIIEYLIDRGVEYILGIPGHGCLPLFDALRKNQDKIKYIQVKQEMAAVHIADGYFRATGKPLAVFTSIGPGALNTIIGLGTSYVDSTGVLVFCGDVHTNMRGVGVLQEIERKHDSDFLACMRPVTKRCWRVESPEQIQKIMNRAFSEMTTGRKGPCVIGLPMDVQAMDTSASIKWSDDAPSLPSPDSGKIKEAYELFKGAKRPVIMAGGAVYYEKIGDDVTRLAENFGAAIVTTMASKSAVPEDHPLYVFHGGSKGTDVGNYICRNADVILSLGCRFADESTSSYRKGITYDFDKTKLIQVDLDAGELGKNYSYDIGIVADVNETVASLNSMCKEKCDYEKSEYFADITRAKNEWFAYLKKRLDVKLSPASISQYLKTMNDTLPEDAILCTSSGNTQAQILQEYVFKQKNTHITTGGFSTMGFAFPAAIGAKLANPGKMVCAVMGDGDFMMSMQELSTLAQYNIPVMVLMFNNMGWFAIKDLQADVFGEDLTFGNDFEGEDGKIYTPKFMEIAESFGIKAFRTDTASGLEELIKLYQGAKEPVFIEIMCNRTYPYSGGGATGWWDVPIPGYMPKLRAKYLEGKNEEQHDR